MPKKTEYVLAVKIDGNVHRAWLPRKAEAVAFGKALGKLIDFSIVTGIEAVCVADVNGEPDAYCYHAGGELWPKG